MKLLYLILIIKVFTVNSQTTIDTLYDKSGEVEAYGEIKNGKRIGTWYFNIRDNVSYRTITYLDNNVAIVKEYSNSDDYNFIDFDEMYAKRLDTIHNDKFYLLSYKEVKYDSSNYNIIYNGMIYTYYPNGSKISSIFFKDRRPDGKWEFFYDNGNILALKYFKNGYCYGKWITYYKSPKNQIFIKGRYSKNAKKGVWKEYYPNGVLKKKYEYNKGIKAVYVTYDNIDSLQKIFPDEYLEAYAMAREYPYNYKTGIWKYYSDKGKLIKKEFYKQGILIDTKTY